MNNKIVKGLAIGVLSGVVINTVLAYRERKLEKEMYPDCEVVQDEHIEKE